MRALRIRLHRARFVYASMPFAQARNAFARGTGPPLEHVQPANQRVNADDGSHILRKAKHAAGEPGDVSKHLIIVL